MALENVRVLNVHPILEKNTDSNRFHQLYDDSLETRRNYDFIQGMMLSDIKYIPSSRMVLQPVSSRKVDFGLNKCLGHVRVEESESTTKMARLLLCFCLQT